MKLLRIGLIFGIIIFLAPMVLQAEPAVVTPTLPATFGNMEQIALESESRGDNAAARAALANNLRILLNSYQKADKNQQGLLAAIGTAYLHKTVSLFAQDYQYAAALKWLEEIKPDSLTNEFQTWRDYYRADLYLKTNEIGKARAIYHGLGLINDWQIIGPFDNENGSGFNTPYPPESEINLELSYDGKKIPVSWRHLQLDELAGGSVNLAGYLRPNRNAVGYALTYVRSDKERPVNLRLASAESIKVWVNRQMVHSNDLQRKECTIDQDTASVLLRAGWNEILVKTAVTQRGWGFRLRVVDAEGQVIPSLRYDAGKTVNRQFTVTPSPRRDVGVAIPTADAIWFLDQAIKANPEAPNNYFYKGWIYQSRADFDYQKPLDREAFNKTAQAAVNAPYYLYYYAHSLREENLALLEQEENLYRSLLENVLEAAPGHLPALTDMAEYYLFSQRNKVKCRDYLNRALKVNADFAPARYLEIEWLQEEGFTAGAGLRLEELSEKQPAFLPAQFAYARQKWGEGRLDIAQTVYQHILREVDYANETARESLGKLLIRVGEVSVAEQLFEVMLRLNPVRLDIYLARAKLREGRDDYAGALKDTQQALQVCPDDDTVLTQEGQYFNRLGQVDEARQAWQKALRINPNNAALQRYLEWVENTGESFETPYRQSLEAVLTGAPDISAVATAGSATDFSAYYFLDQTVIKLNKDGTSRLYSHRIVRVLDEKGIQDFQQVRLPFNPESQRVKVLANRVIYPDGRRLDAPYKDGSTLNLPPLVRGATLDVEYRVDDLLPGFFGDYFGDTFYFAKDSPTYKLSYVLITPADKPIYFHAKNSALIKDSDNLEPRITKSGSQTTYLWEVHNVPSFSSEPLMPPREEVMPVLQVSTYKDWQAFGKWYWYLIKRQYDFNDDMREVLNRLIYRNMKAEDKIREVYNFVIGDIRYVAWEYGIHGWKPYRASTIFARRFGDCKDKATLINVFLNELGIKSYPVILYADDAKGEDDLTLPMVEHFNHCIAYAVPDKKEGIWLDGTAGLNRMGTLPGMDAGAKVFVLNEEGGELKQIPPARPEDNGRREKAVIRLNKKGDARLETDMVFLGDRGSEIRYALVNPARRKLVVERMFGVRYGRTEVTAVDTSPLTDLEIPVNLRLEAVIPDFGTGQETDMTFKPVIFPQDLSGLVTQSERQYDLVLPLSQYPCEDNVETKFILPFGYQVKSVPEKVDITNKFGVFRLNCQVTDKGVTFTEKISLTTRRIAREDYKAFREFCQRITREENHEIVITPK